MSKLWCDTVDTFVADDYEHLAEVYYEYHMGMEFDGDIAECFEIVPDNQQKEIFWTEIPEGLKMIEARLLDENEEDDNHFDDATHLITALAKEWAAWQEEGFLCSTEY